MTYPFRQARYYQPAHRRRGTADDVKWIVLHSAEGGELEDTAGAVAAFFATKGPPPSSAHYTVDGGTEEDDAIWQSVLEIDVAYGAAGANRYGIHIEQAGKARQTRDEWLDNYGRRLLPRVARLIRDIGTRWDVPFIFRNAADLRAGRRGITTHREVDRAWPSCVTADTPILCADLSWRPAGDLLPGDELIGFDEHSPGQEGRRMRRTRVVRNELTRAPLLAIQTPESTIRCTHDHPWLIRVKRAKNSRGDEWGHWEWAEARSLMVDDVVMHVLEPWLLDRSWESGWLAGMYDGEGSLAFGKARRPTENWNRVFLACHQRESDTAERMIQAIKDRCGCSVVRRLDKGPNRQPLVQVVVTRMGDVMRILGSVRPPRLLAKAGDFWEGASLGKRCTRVPILSVEPDGTGLIASLTTESRTYIAGGFAMHNSGHTDPGEHYPLDVLFALLYSEQPPRQEGLFMHLTEAEEREVLDRLRRLDAVLSKAGAEWNGQENASVAAYAAAIYANTQTLADHAGIPAEEVK